MRDLLIKAISTATILLAALSAQAGLAPTFWTGPTTNYMEPAPKAADVLVPGVASLARDVRQWLYNTNTESGPTTASPTFTEWAFGSLANATNLSYQTFASFRDGLLEDVLVTVPPSPMVCHLSNATINVYLSVTFTAWPASGANNGLFAYTRSTPAVAPPTPTVSITNPPSGETLAAPANLTISANAAVSSGTVTNVSFFGNSSLLGSSQSSPFSITANSLGAGPYALTAVATAAGVSATSSVVNVTVVTPVITSLSSAIATANNQFIFSYNVNPGLSYVVEGSGDLNTFTPLETNIPSSSPAFFTNPISGSENFFRVGRMPNP